MNINPFSVLQNVCIFGLDGWVHFKGKSPRMSSIYFRVVVAREEMRHSFTWILWLVFTSWNKIQIAGHLSVFPFFRGDFLSTQHMLLYSGTLSVCSWQWWILPLFVPGVGSGGRKRSRRTGNIWTQTRKELSWVHTKDSCKLLTVLESDRDVLGWCPCKSLIVCSADPFTASST